MQFPDLGDGQAQRDKIRHDTDCGMREGQTIVVDALALMLAIPLHPGIVDRGTDEDGS